MERLSSASVEEIMDQLFKTREKQLKLRQEMAHVMDGDVFDAAHINAKSEELKHCSELVENILEEISNRSAGEVRKCLSLCNQGLGNLRGQQEKVAASRLGGDENPEKTNGIKTDISALKWVQKQLNDILKDNFAKERE